MSKEFKSEVKIHFVTISPCLPPQEKQKAKLEANMIATTTSNATRTPQAKTQH